MALTDLPDFLTIKQTADELQCHPDTVAALLRRGELKAVRLGRAIRIVSESVTTLAKNDDRSRLATEAENVK